MDFVNFEYEKNLFELDLMILLSDLGIDSDMIKF